jgi:hypothetical protein
VNNKRELKLKLEQLGAGKKVESILSISNLPEAN